MSLPTVGQFIKMANRASLAPALLNNPPVTEANDQYDALIGNASWLGNTLLINPEGIRNYWYVPDYAGGVSIGIVHANGFGKAYVISVNYAGCHLAYMWHPTLKQLAFMHVYKGADKMAHFRPAKGWVKKDRISSIGLPEKFGLLPVWSISCIDRSSDPPIVQSKFIGVKIPPPPTFAYTGEGAARTHVGSAPAEIMYEDPGTAITDWG